MKALYVAIILASLFHGEGVSSSTRGKDAFSPISLIGHTYEQPWEDKAAVIRRIW